MEDWLIVVSLSVAMLIGCYVAGCIPLAFTFSEEKLKLVTILGAGLLVGTALVIIIPEGVSTMYSTKHHHHDHDKQSNKLTENTEVDVKKQPNSVLLRKIAQVEFDHKQVTQDEHSDDNAHKLIGISLVTGFVFMLLIDQIGGGHSHGGPVSDTEAGPVTHSRSKLTATLGLCVHAAADGIALGAATSVSEIGLTLIVFFAIMLHKAPAAFGLVSFLLHDGLDRGRIRKHLLAFSAAAPIGAILTFFILNNHSKEALAESNATGLAMLFSAGTFLYVATVHILPEVSSTSTRTVSTDGACTQDTWTPYQTL